MGSRSISFPNKKILCKENVVACFKDVDWGRQFFTTSGGTMKTPDGCEHFYKVHSVDKAIEKLNSLMAQSPANKACSGGQGTWRENAKAQNPPDGAESLWTGATPPARR